MEIYLGTRKKIRHPLPYSLLVHCFANAPYGDKPFGYFIYAHIPWYLHS